MVVGDAAVAVAHAVLPVAMYAVTLGLWAGGTARVFVAVGVLATAPVGSARTRASWGVGRPRARASPPLPQTTTLRRRSPAVFPLWL